MHIGTCLLKFHLAEMHSLKGKRGISKSLITKLRSVFNISVAEVATQDKWQILSLGIVCITNEARHADQTLAKILDYVHQLHGPWDILDAQTDIVKY